MLVNLRAPEVGLPLLGGPRRPSEKTARVNIIPQAQEEVKRRGAPLRLGPVLTDCDARLGADVDRSGRTEARTGLRMMPTSPRSPLSFRTAGFPRYGWKAGLFRRGLPNTSANLSLLPACAGRCLVCVHPSCASSPQQWHRSESGLWARLRTAIRWSLHHPRGPRSGPGCSVPVRHHLIGPIRPTRGHIAISPHGGLYAMPSL